MSRITVEENGEIGFKDYSLSDGFNPDLFVIRQKVVKDGTVVLCLGTDRFDSRPDIWLDQELMRELLPYLTRFAKTGRLSEQRAEKSEVKK